MLRRLLLALVSGLCIWLALPGHDLWYLAFVGVAALALATTGLERIRTGFLIGFVAGWACFGPALYWSGIYVGHLPWIALATSQALYIAGLGAGLAVVQRNPTRVRVLLGAALWVASEALRGAWPFGGFPWARLAFSQADSPLVHLASIAGAPGLTFAVALVGGLLAFSLERAVLRPERFVLTAAPVLGSAALLLVGLYWPTPTDGKQVTVAGIQGNVPTSGLDFNAQRRAVLNNHLSLTREVASEVRAGKLPQPDLVVWPENSSDIDPLRDADAANGINAAVADVDAPVIVGAVLQEPSPKVSNASLLYEPGRGLTDRYVKQHPVPFAEYIPYRSFFRNFSDKVDLVTADFTAGQKTVVFDVPTRAGTIKVSPAICFEVAYDDLMREPVRQGATLLAVPTNNATFGYTDESVQQLAISRVRAIEHGRSIVHISTVGESALITPDGVAHQQSSLFTRDALVGKLPLRTEMTLSDRMGRWPELAVCALALLGVASATVRRRKDKVLTQVGVDHRARPDVAASEDRPADRDTHGKKDNRR
ncbi:apolipoprotein N-acyltransferase [Dermacoccaceae bacterium W4C1]